MVKIRQTKDIQTIKDLHEKLFPQDELPTFKNSIYWCGVDRSVTCCFAIATKYSDDILFLSRAAVNYEYRGKGIHKRLISVRLRYARRHKYRYVITYTSRDNYSSANNLMDLGFRSYCPEYKYVGEDYNYWILEI